MSALEDFSAPLKLQRVRTNGKQHPMAAQQYEQNCSDLFLEPDKPSCLKVLERTVRKECRGISRTKSRTNTDSTLVDADEALGLTKHHEGDGTLTEESGENLVLTSTEITNVDQLRLVLPFASDLTAFHIPQRNSWSCLSVTQDIFDVLCLQIDVFAVFRDSIMNMGSRNLELEIAPPPLRWRCLGELVDTPDPDGWETSYALRYIQQNYRTGGRPWSLRQFAVHNKCSLSSGLSSWILVSPSDEIMSDFGDVACHQDISLLETNVSLHVAFIDTTIAYFRPYLAYLTREVDEHNRRIKFADPMDGCLIDLAADGTRLKLKTLDDDVTDALLALKANKEAACALNRMWRCCRVPIGHVDEQFSVLAILTEKTRDIDAFCRQLQSLRDKLATCTQIVSSFSELSNGQALQANGRSLKQLAEAAVIEGKRTMALTKRTQQDAAAAKALTVIALIYLPTTVVLNFFSTPLIGLPDGQPVLAAKWWLFLAIGGPLTVVTILAWFLWVRAHETDAGRKPVKYTDQV